MKYPKSVKYGIPNISLLCGRYDSALGRNTYRQKFYGWSIESCCTPAFRNSHKILLSIPKDFERVHRSRLLGLLCHVMVMYRSCRSLGENSLMNKKVAGGKTSWALWSQKQFFTRFAGKSKLVHLRAQSSGAFRAFKWFCSQQRFPRNNFFCQLMLHSHDHNIVKRCRHSARRTLKKCFENAPQNGLGVFDRRYTGLFSTHSIILIGRWSVLERKHDDRKAEKYWVSRILRTLDISCWPTWPSAEPVEYWTCESVMRSFSIKVWVDATLSSPANSFPCEWHQLSPETSRLHFSFSITDNHMSPILGSVTWWNYWLKSLTQICPSRTSKRILSLQRKCWKIVTLKNNGTWKYTLSACFRTPLNFSSVSRMTPACLFHPNPCRLLSGSTDSLTTRSKPIQMKRDTLTLPAGGGSLTSLSPSSPNSCDSIFSFAALVKSRKNTAPRLLSPMLMPSLELLILLSVTFAFAGAWTRTKKMNSLTLNRTLSPMKLKSG